MTFCCVSTPGRKLPRFFIISAFPATFASIKCWIPIAAEIPSVRRCRLLLYFAWSLFVSAVLLFLVQPMIGKMILPRLGGTPAVWNTCMVFFQGVLLIGYGYTHLLATTQSTRRQVLIHGALLLLPFLVLPFSLGDWTPPTESNPIFSLLWKLSLMVGLPFLLVSTTAPLLQKWFSQTGHPAAKDPYFLYGASNFGSLLGLALYPSVMEPWFVVSAQADPTWHTQVNIWTIGYAIFVALVIGCAVIVWQAISNRRQQTPDSRQPEPAPTPAPAAAAVQATAVTAAPPKKRTARLESASAAVAAPSSVQLSQTETKAPWEGLHPVWAMIVWWYTSFYVDMARHAGRAETDLVNPPRDEITTWRRIRWIGLAAAPSSLMLGVTTYMTTDIAAIALFWIIPLALYLITFILVFSRWPWIWTGTPHTIVMFLQPMVLLLLVLKMIANLTPPTSWATVIEFALNLGAFFTTTLMCHGELAKDRPSTKHLTEFYFWMSLGGVLGGLFNALFSPVVFQHGIWEYPIAMAFACLMRSNLVDQPKTLIPGDSTAAKPTPFGIVLDFTVPLFIGLACYGMSYVGDFYGHQFFLLKKSYMLAFLVVVVLALSLRPVRFGLAVGGLFIAVNIYDRVYDPYFYEGRGFFGLLRVRQSDEDENAERNWTPLPPKTTGKQSPYEWKVYRTLIHGGINHGRQIIRYRYEDENGNLFKESESFNKIKRREPITYFHERNGVAELFHKLAWRDAQPVTAVVNMTGLSDARLPAAMVGLAAGDAPLWGMLANTQSEPPYAVLGLGTGILACYAKPFQHVDIYEIDPLVKDLSIPPGYVPPWDEKRKKDYVAPEPVFYFVQDAQERWAKIDVILGDGRLKIKEAHAENYYHIIALDAFSSDAIPVHLLTKDAVQIYLSKLAPGGVLLFNTTNRYVRIEGVLAAIAEECDCDCLYCPDYTYETTDHPDRFSADWVVLQPRMKEGSFATGGRPIRERLEALRDRLTWYGAIVKDDDGKPKTEQRWHDVKPLPGPVWTDGYSNMLNPRVMPWIAPWRK
jgi:hypothetical protein